MLKTQTMMLSAPAALDPKPSSLTLQGLAPSPQLYQGHRAAQAQSEASTLGIFPDSTRTVVDRESLSQ